jgi:hypothetical protein
MDVVSQVVLWIYQTKLQSEMGNQRIEVGWKGPVFLQQRKYDHGVVAHRYDPGLAKAYAPMGPTPTDRLANCTNLNAHDSNWTPLRGMLVGYRSRHLRNKTIREKADEGQR